MSCACPREQCRSDIAHRDVAESSTSSSSSADVSSLVIAAPVDGFQITGDIGCQVEPRVAPVRPGCGEFAARLPPCRYGLCDPLFCMCECSSGTRIQFEAMCDRRVRFNPNVEGMETVTIGPRGERHAVDSHDPLAPKEVRYQHTAEVRHAARTNFLKFHCRGYGCEEEIEESSLGVTGWAFSEVRDWTSIDLEKSMALGSPGVNSCINIDHEPRTATPDTVDMMRQSRRRRMALDSLGVQTVQLLDAIGALDSVIEKIEASILPVTTDDDEGDILGVDS